MVLSDIHMLQLEITSHCNIRCPQCSRRDFDGHLAEYIELKHWDMDRVIKNLQIDKLVNLQVVAIEGDNGDAMMHPQIEKLLDAFYSVSVPVVIITNGSMRTPDWWRELGRKYKGGLRVQFSVDGLEDTHKIYRVDCDYHKVITNAQAFMDGGGQATQRTIVFAHNQHQLAEISQKSKDDGFSRLDFIPNDVERFKGYDSWPVMFKGIQINTIYPLTLDESSLSKHDFSKVSDPVIKKGNTQGQHCPAFKRGQLYITYKGHVIPCCGYHTGLYFNHPSNDKFKEIVGDVEKIDIHTQSLETILSDDNFYNNRLNNNLMSENPLPRCLTFCEGQF